MALDILGQGLMGTVSSVPASYRRLGLGGDRATNAVFRQLYDIIARGGRIDPYMYNRQLQAVARDTQNARDAVKGELAGRGLSNANIAPAVDASILTRGLQTQGDIRGQEASDAMQRLMQAFGIYGNLVVDPAQRERDRDLQLDLINRQDKENRRRRMGALAGTILGTAGTIFGGPIGGAIGAAAGNAVAGGK